ncbi:putative glycosyl transferase [Leptomonas seymouri]|uniref:Fucosyltransferase n=1 Tax=Leptomonas seymouri TaxID=5684 RepID=A0A0N1PBV7_LEPSE|nr:putative glycosyl transferase [Leptomonas seymouri]|eukprot:KPI84270.1 putative glycosyl transferase [Leptomonas seymouri]
MRLRAAKPLSTAASPGSAAAKAPDFADPHALTLIHDATGAVPSKEDEHCVVVVGTAAANDNNAHVPLHWNAGRARARERYAGVRLLFHSACRHCKTSFISLKCLIAAASRALARPPPPPNGTAVSPHCSACVPALARRVASRSCRRALLHYAYFSLLLLLLVLGMGTVADLLMGFALRRIGLNLQVESDGPPAALVDGVRVPWLQCDCAGVSVLGDLGSSGDEADRTSMRAQLQRIYGFVDLLCSVCKIPSRAGVDGTQQLEGLGDLAVTPGSGDAARPFAFYGPLTQAAGTVMQMLGSGAYTVSSLLLPESIALWKWTVLWYTAHVESTQALLLQDRQNRGVEGHAIHPPSLWSFAMTVLDRCLHGEATALTQPDTYLVAGVHGTSQQVCQRRAPLERIGLPRRALPWLEIQAAAFRTKEEWVLDPRGRERLLPFSVPSSSAARDRLRSKWLTMGYVQAEELEGRPEITVSVPSSTGGSLRSYLCSGLVNLSHTNMEYVMDPVRTAALRRSYGGPPAAADTSRRAHDPPTDSKCTGCAIRCVHPSLARRVQQHRHTEATPAGEETDGAISWDVALEDVDAGLIQLPARGDRMRGEGDEVITVTRDDIFTCKVLYRSMFTITKDPALDDDLLLSTDVWLSHFSDPLPVVYANYSSAAAASVVREGDAHPATASSTTCSSPERVPMRLLPVHTAAVYGESLQSFPDYALRQAHWTQFDAVYLPQRVRRPSLLRRRPRRPATHSFSASAPTTRFYTWTVTHLYLRDFQLIVYLNQKLRAIREREPHRRVLLETDLAAQVTATSGVIPRLALELLYGADPMLLPMEGEDLHAPSPSGVGWRPPTVEDWSGRATFPSWSTNDTAGGRQMPPSPSGRIPAIAVAISHCWHGRLWWLSELSRYYPVHNFGRCRIPSPSPLPGDVAEPAPSSAGGIPMRAQNPFPEECTKTLSSRHLSALQRARQNHSSPTVGQPRMLTQLARDCSLRCAFRKYKYVLAFENSIEDDYVTEKVYNALLSGALPLYVGAMNIDEYIPQSGLRRDDDDSDGDHRMGSLGRQRKSSATFGLPVLPVLQLFPLLNETAARLEARRVLGIHEADEAMSRGVLRAHTAALRSRASRARRQTAQPRKGVTNASFPVACGRVPRDAELMMAAQTAEVLARALDEVAQQASHNTSASHFLLYSTSASTAEDSGRAELLDANNAGNAAADASDVPFRLPIGVWPMTAPTTPPNEEGQTEGRVAVGLLPLLRRVHRDLSNGSNRSSTKVGSPREPRARVRDRDQDEVRRGKAPSMYAVRARADNGVTVTANTAFGFAEEVARKRAEAATAAASKPKAAPLRRGTPAMPDRIEIFDEEAEDGGEGQARNSTSSTARVRRSRGDEFSKSFARRRLPPAAAYEAARMRSDGPPMNGFAQLASYLRTLDADPSLVAQAGFFDWWNAERLEDFGAAFSEKLHTPHPICSICAAALEKKQRRGPL